MGIEELILDWGQFTGHVTINVSVNTNHNMSILLMIYDDQDKIVLKEYHKQTLIRIPISVLYKGSFRYEVFVNEKLIKSGNLII